MGWCGGLCADLQLFKVKISKSVLPSANNQFGVYQSPSRSGPVVHPASDVSHGPQDSGYRGFSTQQSPYYEGPCTTHCTQVWYLQHGGRG